ncbi:NRDE family protein [Frigoribacterium faeni]|uniref:NRDE family protein n=1 Tax=Frigoribacterium faeni TaxID=145483 RepID=UPI00141BE7BD|nr:hypothetical protein [Frigoribacterium faeni]
MCTVVVSVAPGQEWPVVFLGLRDESADRPWDPPAAWWPELGDRVEGLHDREAGGAWLATASGPARAAVVLNRREQPAAPAGGWHTRGSLPLDAASAGRLPTGRPLTRTFNLLSADASGAVHTSWDGERLSSAPLAAGVHVLTHGAPDDESVPRVARWAPRFRAAAAPTGPLPGPMSLDAPAARPGHDGRAPDPDDREGSWRPWLDLLRESSALALSDDEALVRADLLQGTWFGSLSLSVVALSADRVAHEHLRLDAGSGVDLPGALAAR